MSKSYPKVPLSEVLKLYQEYIDEPGPKVYPKLSVKLYGRGVVLDSPVDGSSLKMKRHQIAKGGQIILSEIWGKKGAIGLVPTEGEGALCTSHFFLFDINSEKIEIKYLQAIFTANYLEEQLDSEAKGTTGYAAVKPKHLLSANIPLPPVEEQRRIVARIEEVAAKIEEARGLHTAINSDIYRTLLSAYNTIIKGARRLPMRDVAPLERRSIEVKPEEEYFELGIRSFGKGTFHKPAVTGAALGTKRIFSIEEDDLLFNIVFAWEGAVAVAKSADHGRVGSHRFLTCVPKKGLATPFFLCFHFLTKEGLQQLLDASPGSAGRNRTLGIKALEEIQVPVPPFKKQLWFDSLQERFNLVRRCHAETSTELDALLPSILDKAFKGEL